jgi:hypothetical protein
MVSKINCHPERPAHLAGRASRLLYLHLCLRAYRADHIAGGRPVFHRLDRRAHGNQRFIRPSQHNDQRDPLRSRRGTPVAHRDSPTHPGAAFLVSGSTKNSWLLVAAFAVAITGLYATQGII